VIIILASSASDAHIQHVCDRLAQRGYEANVSRGVERTLIGAVGKLSDEDKSQLADQLQSLEYVERVVPISRPYKLVSREGHDQTTIPLGDHILGSEAIILMAGPCSVESESQIVEAARAVKAAGAHVLRGGAFKPRTSPYDFQGHGLDGLKMLRTASLETGLPIITEVLDVRDVEAVCAHAQMLQIGTRNMANFQLLREVGQTHIPVMLKRGWASTIDEWLKAAEYLLAGGNHYVTLCERGIRTFEPSFRNTLDLAAVPAVKKLTHLPVVVDPSQGTGRWDMVEPMSLAAIAAGADGLLIEVHPDPETAWSDGAQSLSPSRFARFVERARPVAVAVGRTLT